MEKQIDEERPMAPSRRPLRKRRPLLLLAYFVFLAGVIAAAIKLIPTARYGVPLIGREEKAAVWDAFYPELRKSGVRNVSPDKDDRVFNVVLLGASVLHQVGKLLEDELQMYHDVDVRVFDLAVNSHTSRDSYLKHQELPLSGIDLIVIYHGINDVRMNCCPETRFQDDYSHCSWYKVFQCRLAGESIPTISVMQELIPHETPRDGERRYGRTIKTEGAFRQNLESIVSAAQSNRQQVVLMTFAYYIPPDYSVADLVKGRLDYGLSEISFVCPAELWGDPENVVKTIDVHNRVIIDLAKRFENVIFIDQTNRMQKAGRNFSDPCHLTAAGCKSFVDNMVEEILQRTNSSTRERSELMR